MFGWKNDGTLEIYELGKKMVDVIVMTFIMYLYRLHSEEAWRRASHGGGGGGGGGGGDRLTRRNVPVRSGDSEGPAGNISGLERREKFPSMCAVTSNSYITSKSILSNDDTEVFLGIALTIYFEYSSTEQHPG